ncbi:PQ-loop domain-containing transporter [Paenibacillus sp. MBLB4367]|uniref:PQ-loop domain-containing transporter n=1 Tax=Paenibacillus sp. MBLB4367 TaxID=3384767 RepID=UPI00390841C1
MNVFDLLQLTGGIMLSFGYIPQIIQITKTKSVKDLNSKTLFFVFFGIFLMEIYAIHLVITGSGWMFLVTNSMALVLAGSMFQLTYKYKK